MLFHHLFIPCEIQAITVAIKSLISAGMHVWRAVRAVCAHRPGLRASDPGSPSALRRLGRKDSWAAGAVGDSVSHGQAGTDTHVPDLLVVASSG